MNTPTSAPTPPMVQTFMTHQMTDEAILMLATGREGQTEDIMDAVKRSLKAAPGALQHIVIYGPRGFGKSFMARLVQTETAKLAAQGQQPVPFVLLPEEQQNLTRNPHALPAYIAHKLMDLRTGQDSSWTSDMFQWPTAEKEAKAWDDATQELERELDLSLPNGQGMAIVVIENFDFLLTSVFKDEKAEQRLRKWLDRRGNRVMLIATATGSVDMDYNRPLFQAFQSIRLEPWDRDDCINYFNRRRQAEGKPPLPPELEAKARAVADFIGGNPRLAQLLADVLDTQDALSVADTMKALADKLSDYYRRRIDDLPPLAQGLLDALIRGGEPASQTALAARVGAPAQSAIARVMQDLQRSDTVRGVPAPGGRETLYRVTDRVFVHFYRLRQGHVMALKTPLSTILEFLRTFYSHDEQRQQALKHLSAGREAEARLFADLAKEGGGGLRTTNSYMANFGRWLEWNLAATDETLPMPVVDLRQQMDECPEKLIKQSQAWPSGSDVVNALTATVAAQAYARLGLMDKALERLEQQLAASATPAAKVLLHRNRSALLLVLNRREEAYRAEKDSGDLASEAMLLPVSAFAYLDRARSQNRLSQYADALASARHAAKLWAQLGDVRFRVGALLNAAGALEGLHRSDESLACALEAAALAEQAGYQGEQVGAMLRVGAEMCVLGKFEESLATLRGSVALAEHLGDTDSQFRGKALGAISLNAQNKPQEALVEALAAFELAMFFDLDDSVAVWRVAYEAIKAAAVVPSTEAVAALCRWVAQQTSADEPSQDKRPWLGDVLAATARAGAWHVWNALIDHHAGILKRQFSGWLQLASTGRAIALCGTTEGRAAGFDSARGALRCLASLWRLSPDIEANRERHLTALTSSFAESCKDPSLLVDVAGLFTEDVSPQAPRLAELLVALAHADDASDPQAALARMDPDVALWVRRIRDLPEPLAAPPRRRSGRG